MRCFDFFILLLTILMNQSQSSSVKSVKIQNDRSEAQAPNKNQCQQFNSKSESYDVIELNNPITISSSQSSFKRRKEVKQRAVARTPPLELGEDLKQLQCRSYFYFSNVLRSDAIVDMTEANLEKVGQRRYQFKKINPNLVEVSQMREQIIKYLFGRFHGWVFELSNQQIIEIYKNTLKERAFLEQRQRKYKTLSQIAQQPGNQKTQLRKVNKISNSSCYFPNQSALPKKEVPKLSHAYPTKRQPKGKTRTIPFFTFSQQEFEKNKIKVKNARTCQEIVEKDVQEAPRKRVHRERSVQNEEINLRSEPKSRSSL